MHDAGRVAWLVSVVKAWKVAWHAVWPLEQLKQYNYICLPLLLFHNCLNYARHTFLSNCRIHFIELHKGHLKYHQEVKFPCETMELGFVFRNTFASFWAPCIFFHAKERRVKNFMLSKKAKKNLSWQRKWQNNLLWTMELGFVDPGDIFSPRIPSDVTRALGQNMTWPMW